MNGIVGLAESTGPSLIDGLAEHVHHAAERRAPHGNLIGVAGIDSFHAADHAFGRLHGHGAHAAFAEVLLHFGSHVQRFGRVEAFAGDAHGVVNGRANGPPQIECRAQVQ